MQRSEFSYIGSFQQGYIFRTGDPTNAAWRYIERAGTIDNLRRIAAQRGHNEEIARGASLRIRQAIELRKSAANATTLTRPLLLYYSALNLARGLLATRIGDFGEPSHGLTYEASSKVLECSAKISKKGTFPKLMETYKFEGVGVSGGRLSLRDALANIPEIAGDFYLLDSGPTSVAFVRVRAIAHGALTLLYDVEGVEEKEFEENWQSMLPWFKDDCEYEAPYTLRLKNPPKTLQEVKDFCKENLLHDLNWREDAIWFDFVSGKSSLVTRICSYIAALFILSNMSRYEPELLDDATRDPTDLAYVLNRFLDHVERYFPQIILETLYGQGVFFT